MPDELEQAKALLRDAGVASELVESIGPEAWDDRLRDHIVWDGPATMTAAQVGARCDLDEAAVRRAWALFGFPDPGDRVEFRTVDIELFRIAADAMALFGPLPTEQFIRAIGAAARRIPEAAIALVGESRGAQPELSILDRLRLGQMTYAMARRLAEVLTSVILHHFDVASTFRDAAYEPGTGTLQLTVGFCDLVGSTELTNAVSSPVMASALAAFEGAAADAVITRGGRVVKFVGDEVMFAVADAALAVEMAVDIIGWVAAHPTLGSARGGIAHGEVFARDGDLYGRTVNLAARLASIAPDGCALIEDPEGVARVSVRGFEQPVAVRTISGR